MNTRARLSAALLLLAGATGVQAAMRLQLEPVFSHRRPQDRVLIGVLVENDAEPRAVVLSLQQGDIEPPRRTELPLSLAPFARRQFVLSLDAAPGRSDFAVQLEQEGDALATSSVRVPSLGADPVVVGTLGEVPGWLRRRDDARIGLTAIQGRLLPERSLGWPAVDVILWPAPRANELEATQVQALLEWVERGGELLVGQALDQPAALQELGLAALAPRDGTWHARGFGAVALVDRDCSRVPPPLTLRLGPELREHDDRHGQPSNYWAMSGSLSDVLYTLQVDEQHRPRPPVLPVAVILLGYLIAAVPLELSRQRRALRRGRPGRGGLALRFGSLAVAVGLVLFACTGFRAQYQSTQRLDVIDVDVSSGVARGHSFLISLRARGGWQELRAGEGQHLAPLRPARMNRGYGRRRGPRVGDAARSSLAATRPLGISQVLRTESPPWTQVGAQLAFAPENGRWKELLTELRSEGRIRSTPSRVYEPIVDGASEALDRLFWQCSYSAFESDDALFACAAWLCDRDGFRTSPRTAPTWTPGASAVLVVSDEAAGPPLQLDGVPVAGPARTVFRFRTSPSPREAAP